MRRFLDRITRGGVIAKNMSIKTGSVSRNETNSTVSIVYNVLQRRIVTRIDVLFLRNSVTCILQMRLMLCRPMV